MDGLLLQMRFCRQLPTLVTCFLFNLGVIPHFCHRYHGHLELRYCAGAGWGWPRGAAVCCDLLRMPCTGRGRSVPPPACVAAAQPAAAQQGVCPTCLLPPSPTHTVLVPAAHAAVAAWRALLCLLAPLLIIYLLELRVRRAWLVQRQERERLEERQREQLRAEQLERRRRGRGDAAAVV